MRMVAKCQGVTLESRVHELGCELITLTVGAYRLIYITSVYRISNQGGPQPSSHGVKDILSQDSLHPVSFSWILHLYLRANIVGYPP